MSRQDKARYEMEKKMYKGPWRIPAKLRKTKDSDAPKRPTSAYIMFAVARRAQVKAANPGLKNGELARLLASMWKEASDEDKKEYIDREFELRQEYKVLMQGWKQKEAKKVKDREDAAMKAVLEGKDVDNLEGPYYGAPTSDRGYPKGTFYHYASRQGGPTVYQYDDRDTSPAADEQRQYYGSYSSSYHGDPRNDVPPRDARGYGGYYLPQASTAAVVYPTTMGSYAVVGT